MKKLLVLSALGLAVAACQPEPAANPTQAPVAGGPNANPQTISTAQTVAEAQAQSMPKPVTISGGAGSTCLAVDVLANDGAFIRAGTAGTLSGDVFTVNGQRHDMSGINYSVKGC